MRNVEKLYTMRVDSINKVLDYFSFNETGTASEIGVSGSFMYSLCNRGIAKYAGKKDVTYYTVDLLPKKRAVTCYSLTMEVEDVIRAYHDSCRNYLCGKIEDKERLIEILKEEVSLLKKALREYEE